MKDASPSREEVRHGLGRRFFFYYILFVILGLQATFVLFNLGFDFEPVHIILTLALYAPMTLTLLCLWLERSRLHTFALRPRWSWLLGFALFGVWTGSYFLVGLVTDPSRVRLIPAVLDGFIPHDPSWVFIYLTVYFVFLLPFLHARRIATLQRLGVSLLVLLSISYGVFLSMPVAYDRPGLVSPPPNLAVWTLAIVYGQDPPWNCLPSTHCAMALIGALAMFEEDRRLGTWALFSAFAIGVSTLFTKQHYIVDVVAGYSLAGLTWWTLRWVWRNPERVPVPEAARRFIGQGGEAAEGASRPVTEAVPPSAGS